MMVRNIAICLFLLSSFSGILYAQEAVIRGTVTDAKTKATLPGVHIVLGNKSGTTTGPHGAYELIVEPGSHQLSFRFVGYEIYVARISLNPVESKTLDVALKETASQLDMVVVSAGRFEQPLSEITVSMEIINPALVENKNTTSMESIVDQVPGVNVVDGQANIRGGGGFSYGAGSRVLVLVDDMPMLSADAGDVKWSFLPVENLEQVEVIKGASSALYGSSALNGAINFRTAYPRDTAQTRINIFHGIYGDPVRRDSLGNMRDSLGNLHKPLKWWDNANPAYTGANFFHSRKIENLDLVLGGHVFSDEGYRELEKEQRARFNFNTRYHSKKIKGLNYGLNGNTMYAQGGLFLTWQDADSGAYRPMGGEVSNYRTFRANIDPYLNYVTENGGRHSLKTRYFNTSNRNDTRQQSIAGFYYGEYHYHKQFKALTATLGAVASYSEVKSELYDNHHSNNLAAFLQADKKIGKLSLSGGLRAEYFRTDTIESREDLRILPINGGSDTLVIVRNSPVRPVLRIGANYQMARATFLRASYGMGYRFPSIAERFVRTSASGLEIYPNPGLEPEKGWSAEAGVKQGIKIANWMGYADLAGFVTKYRNMMEFAFGFWGNPMVDPFFGLGVKSINVGEALIKGGEFSLMGTGTLFGLNTTVLAGYTYIEPLNLNTDSLYRFTLSDTTSNMLKYRFRHMAKADLQVDYKRFSTGISFRYNSFMVNIDAFFEDPLIGAALSPGVKEYRGRNNKGDYVFDYRLAFQVHQNSRVSLIINNLLNREYMMRPADMQPPRTIGIQYTVAF